MARTIRYIHTPNVHVHTYVCMCTHTQVGVSLISWAQCDHGKLARGWQDLCAVSMNREHVQLTSSVCVCVCERERMRKKADKDEVEWGYHPVGAPVGDKSTSDSWQNDAHSTVVSFIWLCSLCWGVPPEVVSVHQQGRWPILGTSNVLLHLFGLHTHHILPLPVLDHVEGLKRANNVLLCEGRHFTEGEVGEGREGGKERG